jgi:MFS family permease
MRELFGALARPVYIPSFLCAAGQTAVSVMLPLYLLERGGHVSAVSVVVGLAGVGSLVANVPAGVLVARIGDRLVMIGALLLGVVATLGIAFVEAPLPLAVLTLLFGVSGGAWMLARLAFMSEAAPPARRGRAIALIGGVHRFGGFVGPVSAGVLAERFGFPVAFAASALAVAAGLLFVLRHARDHRPPATGATPLAGVPVRAGLGSQLQVLRQYRRLFATAGLAVVAIALVRSGYALLIPLWGESIDLDAADVGLLFSILSGIDMLMFYPVGIVMDRFGRKWAGVPCLLGIAASLALLPATTTFASLALVALLCGFANGLGSGIVMTMGSDFAPADRRGEFLGVWRSLADVGHLGAPFLCSVLAAVAGLAGACYTAAAIGVLGALVMAFGFAEPLRRPGVVP